MSTFDANDLETMGYFLPKDSQLRLKKLREHAEFLSHLAQPRTADEEQEWIPEIRAGEVAICLELLAEQMGCVLDDLSWPAYRSEREAALGAGAEPEAAQEVPGDAGGRYIFGMTLEQVDTLNRLIDMITAHGDVVVACDAAEFADHTLSVLGDAIFNDARAVREIIRQVESQRLGQARRSQTGVGEERAVYRAGRCRASAFARGGQRVAFRVRATLVTPTLRWPGRNLSHDHQPTRRRQPASTRRDREEKRGGKDCRVGLQLGAALCPRACARSARALGARRGGACL